MNMALTKLLVNMHRSQNDDGGFAEYGKGTSVILATAQSCDRLFENQCWRSFTWNFKKIVRQSLFSRRITYSNSVRHCGAQMHESNIFATWFRLLTIEVIEVTLGLLNAPEDVELKPQYSRAPGLGYMPFFVKKGSASNDG